MKNSSENTTQHTPGPLEFHEGEDYAVVMLPDDTTDTALCTLNGSDADVLFYGKLFAAAPETARERDELLAALKALRNDPITDGSKVHYRDRTKIEMRPNPIALADAAIAKAEGR